MKQQKNSRRQASSQQNPNASSKAKFDRKSSRYAASPSEQNEFAQCFSSDLLITPMSQPSGKVSGEQ